MREVFRRITIDGKDFVSIEPKAEYVPLFAVIASGQKYGYREFDPTLSPSRTTAHCPPLQPTPSAGEDHTPCCSADVIVSGTGLTSLDATRFV